MKPRVAVWHHRVPLALWCMVLFAGTALSAERPSPDSDLREMQWTVEGVERRGLLHVPTGPTREPVPVVFVFHGHGGSMQNVARSFALHRHWPEALCVYLQGLPTPGMTDPEGKRAGWQRIPGDQQDRDLKLFDAVLAGLRVEFKADESRIYATGHSNGGAFTYLLWASRGDRFAAVAPSASPGGRHLNSLKPKPALHVAGQTDALVPFETQKRTMDAVRRLNGCAEEGAPWATSGSLVGVLFASSTGTPFVTLIHPGGHRFPSEAPALIARFFKEQVRNPPSRESPGKTAAETP